MYLNALPRFSVGIISFCAWLSYSSLSYWDSNNRQQSKGTLLAGSTWTISCSGILERAKRQRSTMAGPIGGMLLDACARSCAWESRLYYIIQLPGDWWQTRPLRVRHKEKREERGRLLSLAFTWPARTALSTSPEVWLVSDSRG